MQFWMNTVMKILNKINVTYNHDTQVANVSTNKMLIIANQ